MSFFSSSDLRNIVKSLKHEDLKTVREELDHGVSLESVFYDYEWMALGETSARRALASSSDFAVLRREDYIAVTSDGDLFKIKINVGMEYGVTNYDEFKAIINHYKETHGFSAIVNKNLMEELKCREYVKTVELEEMTQKNGYCVSEENHTEILKHAYEKGVISRDTMLDKISMFD